MKSYIYLLLSLLLTISCNACSFTRSIKEIYRDNKDSVYALKIGDASCSAFHIGEGLLVTAAHCLKSGNEITLMSTVETAGSKVLLVDKQADTAILYIPDLTDKPFLLLGESPEVGERILVLGYPGYFFDKTIDAGYLLGIGTAYEGIKVIYGNGNAYPGESGSPLLDEKGYIIGLTSSISPGGHQFGFGEFIHRDLAVFIHIDILKEKIALAKERLSSGTTETSK